VALSFGEVYQALQNGVVDGTENPPSNFYTQRMQEQQRFLTVSNHGYLGYAVIVNKKFWDGLPFNIRKSLEDAMKEATKYANAIAEKENDDALDAIRKSGKTTVYTLSDKEKEEWRRVLAPVITEMADRIGRDVIAAVNREAAAQQAK
jgi:C4-dicarboxylate-binding protein DctP